MKLIPGRRSPEERTGSMSVVEHLEELRRRIVICLWAVGIAGIVAWFLYEPFIDVARTPSRSRSPDATWSSAVRSTACW